MRHVRYCETIWFHWFLSWPPPSPIGSVAFFDDLWDLWSLWFLSWPPPSPIGSVAFFDDLWDLWSLWDLWGILDKWDMWDIVRPYDFIDSFAGPHRLRLVPLRCLINVVKVEKHYDRCGSMSLCFRCWNIIMHDFYEGKKKTPRPMRPNVAMLSLSKHNHISPRASDRCGLMSACFRCGNTILHEFYVGWKHHERCGSMSICFCCGNIIMHDFYEAWKTLR